MTTAEAARLLRVSPRYVRQLIELGRLGRSGLGRHQLDPAEVRRLLAERRGRPR